MLRQPTRATRLNLLVVGKTGEGKSATVNSLKKYAKNCTATELQFKEQESAMSVTKSYDQCCMIFENCHCRVIELIGVHDTALAQYHRSLDGAGRRTEDHNYLAKAIHEVFTLCSEGVDAFLFVVDTTRRLTNEAKDTLRIIVEHFGQEVLDRCIFVLTRNDQAKDKSPEVMQRTLTELLKEFGCYHIENRFILFDNVERPLRQVSKLFEIIATIRVKCNEQTYYYKSVSTNIISMQHELLWKETVAEIQPQVERIVAKYEAEMTYLQHNLSETKLRQNKFDGDPVLKNRLDQQAKELEESIEGVDQKCRAEINETIKPADIFNNKLRKLEEVFANNPRKQELNKLAQDMFVSTHAGAGRPQDNCSIQ